MKEKLNPTISIYTKALIIYNRRVLIIRRSNYTHHGNGEWDIPGGGLDFDETVLDCLHREIKEETGLLVDVDRLLFSKMAIIPTRTDVGAVGLIYICRTNTGAVTLSHEHTEYLWVTKAQLMELLSKPALDDYISNGVFEALDID